MAGKQYFELLQRVLRYGLDFELIPIDPSSGLTWRRLSFTPSLFLRVRHRGELLEWQMRKLRLLAVSTVRSSLREMLGTLIGLGS
jgi:hypothetical protein